jgi:hypothetical protein
MKQDELNQLSPNKPSKYPLNSYLNSPFKSLQTALQTAPLRALSNDKNSLEIKYLNLLQTAIQMALQKP